MPDWLWTFFAWEAIVINVMVVIVGGFFLVLSQRREAP